MTVLTVLYGVHRSAPFLTMTLVVGTTLAVGCGLLWRAQRRVQEPGRLDAGGSIRIP